MTRITKQLLLVIIISIAINSNAQLISKEKRDSLKSKFVRVNNKVYKIMQVVPAPIITYSSETSWVFGLAKFQGYDISKKDTISRASSVSGTVAMSLYGQFYTIISNTTYFGQNKNIISGSVDFEIYPHEWYISNGTNKSKDISELVSPHYITIPIKYLRQITPKYYLGISYNYDNYFKIEYIEDGIFDKINFFGKNGGINSGIGLIAQFDSRDNQFTAYSGTYLNIEGIFYNSAFGSNYIYNKYSFDFRTFKKIKKFVFGYQLYNESVFGKVPLYNHAQLGGSYRMRGFYYGQIRNKVLIDSQIEARTHLFWLISAAAFYGMGTVAPDYSTLQNTFKDKRLLYSYGAGIRLTVDPVHRINIRLDIAFGYDQYNNRNHNAIFFGFSEAF